jgi:hypothetical protein
MSSSEVRKLDALFGIAKPKRSGKKEKEAAAANAPQPSNSEAVPI